MRYFKQLEFGAQGEASGDQKLLQWINALENFVSPNEREAAALAFTYSSPA